MTSRRSHAPEPARQENHHDSEDSRYMTGGELVVDGGGVLL